MNSVAKETLPRSLVFLLATAVGLIAANLYYAQPLIALISRDLGLAPEAAGLVVTLTQIGYGLGVLLAVPLGDLIENKRLVLTMIVIAAFGLLGLAFAQHIVPYFVAAFATGLGTSTVQIIVPYTAHFTTEERRGQTVGQLMSGLMLGIMLSRPTASLLTDYFSWHAVFVLSAGLMTVLALILFFMMPPRQPAALELRFTGLLSSMTRLLFTTPILRRRAFYQAAMFGAFCLFWTATPLLLADVFKLSQTDVAIFALVGIAGAVSAPIAGTMADRGRSQVATFLGLLAGVLSFLLGHYARHWGIVAVPLLAFAGILLDAGVSANLVLGQRAIFSLNPELRGRLNGLYIAIIFIGGATGSALGAWAYARGGWELTSWIGLAMPGIALLYFFTEAKAPQRSVVPSA
ncbi:MAG: MFS transporter [Bdellovibrionales bacterium]|nr:MFS transporter [Bdellovibrionales bacterium]